MDSVASVTDTSAMVRMNTSWQSKLPCSIVTRALGFSYHAVELHRLLRSLSWRIDVAEGHIHFHSNLELTRFGQVDEDFYDLGIAGVAFSAQVGVPEFNNRSDGGDFSREFTLRKVCCSHRNRLAYFDFPEVLLVTLSPT
jgi:hypothetical protein